MVSLAHLVASKSMTILLVEHQIKAALELAESVIIMERGRVAWTGTPTELEGQLETVERLQGVGR